jgi:hypothetical protein
VVLALHKPVSLNYAWTTPLWILFRSLK